LLVESGNLECQRLRRLGKLERFLGKGKGKNRIKMKAREMSREI
jgi:hypothetical protein